jgi:glycosyltransferase involved in cell wall biosynthesis
MRRILVLTSHHPARSRPHHAVYGYHTYQALSHYCDIRFVSPGAWWSRLHSPTEILGTAPVERWGALTIEYPVYWSVPSVTPLHAIGMAASLRGRVAALRRSFDFEAILTAWAYPDAVAAALIAWREKVPLVVTVLGSDINELPKRTALAFQIRHALRRARRVVAVSEALGAEVGRLGVNRDRIVVQHNGVDGDVFSIADQRAARSALAISEGRRLVGYVGRLSPEKGVDVLVEAMAAILRRGGRVDLAIVGSGPSEPMLRARAAQLGIADRVRFLGHRGHDEIPRWMTAFDVFCLPSRREGCPNVVLEALASGRPVVASRVGGVPELLRADNGILVPPDSPSELASAIERALASAWDPASLRRTVPALSWDAVGRRYRDFLDDAIAAASG